MSEDIKLQLIERVEEIGTALASADVEYTPLTALALTELAVQVTKDYFNVSHLEARLRIVQAMLEMGRNELRVIEEVEG